MDWVMHRFGFETPEEDEERIAEQADIYREQEQINLIGRKGEEILPSAPTLPSLQSGYPGLQRRTVRFPGLARLLRALQRRDEASPPPSPGPGRPMLVSAPRSARVSLPGQQRSGMVLPCLCCPPSAPLVSPACPGLPARLGRAPSWEDVEGGVIVTAVSLLLWAILWALAGEDAGPLSAPFYVIMLSLAGHAAGALVGTLTPLPPLYGMLLLPAIAGNLGIRELEVLSDLRADIAAVVVFASVGVFVARAGIDVELEPLQSSSGLVLALGFLPLFAETAFVTVAAAYALDMSWRWAFLLGTLTAPMSPLVVMWTAMELRRAGLGTATAVCSLLLVVCALDAAASFCLFGVAIKCAMQRESWSAIAEGFFELLAGILLGAVIGFFFIYVPNEYNVHATFYRVEMLLAVNVCSVIVFHYFLAMPAVGYLSAFTTACVASNGWKTLSMDSKTTTLRTMMALSWLIMQPLAMSIVGPHIVVARLGGWRPLRYTGVLLAGVLVRLAVSALCCLKSKRRWRERCFICLACVPKGTAQLVMCNWTLLRTFSAEEDRAMAVVVLDCCVWALLVTGPLGSLLSSVLAPRLLRVSEATESVLELQEPHMSF